MRTQIVAGNWKMNCDLDDTKSLIEGLKKTTKNNATEVIIAPSFTNLSLANCLLEDSNIALSAQNMNANDSGAFTGEVSANMLKSVGVTYVILGHSERRAIFHEDAQILKEKTNQALEQNLSPIFCVGEELNVRQNNGHFNLVEEQIAESLFHLSTEEFSKLVIAYEPVWAIGTGETATPEQAQEMHAHIRKVIAKQYDDATANSISILYGGSVKPANAKEIFANPDVDGGLIGGASLKADDFTAIINSF
ncbi:triosephosphate isomerase [Psychroflexus salarius]|uniref:Triosephosphate isomerase n=1 Tax=Psychroflexus salarius TaxID=1155689 RepID=A0A1M4S9T7_9FLAO|nr:triose-phosphate isomerase [Psychroflexus salarius]SHE28905.1 triosephosphate isomerase [Psychroflexus salarius]